jgi:hypothetical protein
MLFRLTRNIINFVYIAEYCTPYDSTKKDDYTMEKVRKLHYKDKEILIVDYSDYRGDNMIDLI